MTDPPLYGFITAGLLIAVGICLYLRNKSNLLNLAEGEDATQPEHQVKIAASSARRRAQTGLLFVLSGMTMFARLRIHPQLSPGLWGGSWILTLLFLLWGILLTSLDLFAVRIQISELKQHREAFRLTADYLNRRKKEVQAGAKEEEETKPG